MENLNDIVQEHTTTTYDIGEISKENVAKRSEELFERLSDVPISLDSFREYLKNGYGEFEYSFADMKITAKLVEPQHGLFLIKELMEPIEADDILTDAGYKVTEISIDSSPLSDDFYNATKHKLGELIVADENDPTAKVYSHPEISGVAVVYGKGDETKYIEIHLNEDYARRNRETGLLSKIKNRLNL